MKISTYSVLIAIFLLARSGDNNVLALQREGPDQKALDERRLRKLGMLKHIRERISGMLQGEGDEDAKANFIVKYINDAGRNDIEQMANAHVLHDFQDDGYVAIQVDDKRDGGVEAVLDQLFLDDNIDAVEEDSIWTEQGTFEGFLSDEEENQLRSRNLAESIPYGIRMVQADQVRVGNNPVQVCVVDTGVAGGHPDLDFSKTQGANRKSNIDGTWLQWNGDTRGHGTHTAGIVAAKAGNGIGVRGMGNIELYITRGLNNKGRARESDVREAIEQCEKVNAKIISLSLSGSSMTAAMKQIVERLYSKGFLILAACGNGGENKAAYPAAHPYVVSVTAVNENETRWSGSNYHSTVELAAAGNLVISTGTNGRYTKYSGTSMATPHVAGAAAILLSHYPDCTNTQIRYALAYTAKDINSDGCDDQYGYGIIQVKDALDFLEEFSCTGAIWGQSPGRTGECSAIDVQPIDLFHKPYGNR